MRFVAIGAGKVVGMAYPILGKIFHNIIVTGSAKYIFNRLVPDIPGRLMGLVTGQAVLQLEIRSMFFMAVQACIGLAFPKGMGMMAEGTILL